MIIIPSMPTRFRPLPQLEIDLEVHELRTLAFVLDRITSPECYISGLCSSVIEICNFLSVHKVNVYGIDHKFKKAVEEGMNPPEENTRHLYLGSYLFEKQKHIITIKELAAIRDAWARHIARSIYEQIGD